MLTIEEKRWGQGLRGAQRSVVNGSCLVLHRQSRRARRTTAAASFDFYCGWSSIRPLLADLYFGLYRPLFKAVSTKCRCDLKVEVYASSFQQSRRMVSGTNKSGNICGERRQNQLGHLWEPSRTPKNETTPLISLSISSRWSSSGQSAT